MRGAGRPAPRESTVAAPGEARSAACRFGPASFIRLSRGKGRVEPPVAAAERVCGGRALPGCAFEGLRRPVGPLGEISGIVRT